MAQQVQFRRGTTAEHSTFTGAAGEVTVDTDKDVVVVHDGNTAGGAPLLRENGSQNAVTTGANTAARFIPTGSSVPTNGVYLPAANTVGVATGGSGRLFINSDGTISAGAAISGGGGVVLFNNGGQTTANLSTSSNNDSFIVARHNSASAGAGGAFIVGAQAGSFAAIKGLLTDGSNNTAGDLAFATRTTSSASTLTERLRITSAGLVGVGTSSPGENLSISGTANVYLSLTSSGGVKSQLNAADATGAAAVGTVTNHPLRLETNNTERLRVTSAGLVGVGTSSPVAKFQINVQDGFRFDVGANAYSYMQFGSAGAGEGTAEIGYERTSAKVFLKNTISGSLTTFLTGDSVGRVGIGTTSPVARVHSDWNGGNQFRASNGSATFDILNDSTNSLLISSGPMFYRTGTSGPHIFQKDGGSSEVARIDASGRLLVGTSSVYGVAGLSHTDIQLSRANADAGYSVTCWKADNIGFNPSLTFMRSYNNTAGSHTALPNGAFLGVVRFTGSDGSVFREGATIRADADGQAWANADCPTKLVFSVTADGASSPTEALRIKNDRSIAVIQAPGKYTISTSEGATSVANNGTIDFSSFSGLILINDHSSGHTQVLIAGGGNVTSLGTAGGTVGSLAYNVGIDGYRWTNNTGATRTFGFFCVRTRPNA